MGQVFLLCPKDDTWAIQTKWFIINCQFFGDELKVLLNCLSYRSIYDYINQLERKKIGQNSFIVSARPGRKPQKAFCMHINCGFKKILTTAFSKNISSSTKSNTACFLQEIVFKKVWNTKKDDKTPPFKQLSHFKRRAALPGVWRWSFWLRQMIVYHVIF